MTKNNFLSHSISTLVLLLLVASFKAETIRIINRRQQIEPMYSMAYSDYTSVQIFEILNWKINDKMITSINNNNFTFKVHHNQFSYLSQDQIQEKYLNFHGYENVTDAFRSSKDNKKVKNYQKNYEKSEQMNPSRRINIDWRNKLTTPVKFQGQCGACWAFTAIADIQSLYIKKFGGIYDFSEQQLIDCSGLFGNYGCTGGMMDNAFKYIIRYGITLESSYPYEKKENYCRYNSKDMPSFSIQSSKILFNTCEGMVKLLQDRPLSIVLSVHTSFLFYSEGIINLCGSKINHSLQLVGLRQRQRNSYYILKNSWGIQWGDKGYAYFDASINNGNICSICSYPQMPF